MYKIAFKIDDSLYSLILFTYEIFTMNKILKAKTELRELSKVWDCFNFVPYIQKWNS